MEHDPNWYKCPKCGFTIKKNNKLEPFLGSGTTAVACKQLNRNFIGFELSPEYCEIANKRLKALPVRLDKFVGNNITSF